MLTRLGPTVTTSDLTLSLPKEPNRATRQSYGVWDTIND